MLKKRREELQQVVRSCCITLKQRKMVQQDGVHTYNGTRGCGTFYKTKDGDMAREKGGIDRKRMATDPAFRRTRENGMEFGTAGKYGKYLRAAIRSVMQSASDKR